MLHRSSGRTKFKWNTVPWAWPVVYVCMDQLKLPQQRVHYSAKLPYKMHRIQSFSVERQKSEWELGEWEKNPTLKSSYRNYATEKRIKLHYLHSFPNFHWVVDVPKYSATHSPNVQSLHNELFHDLQREKRAHIKGKFPAACLPATAVHCCNLSCCGGPRSSAIARIAFDIRAFCQCRKQ